MSDELESLDTDDDDSVVEGYSTLAAGFKLEDFFGRTIDVGDCFATILGSGRHKYLGTGVITGYRETPKQTRIFYDTGIYSRSSYFLFSKNEKIKTQLIKIENLEFLLNDLTFQNLYKVYLKTQDDLAKRAQTGAK